MVLRKPSLAVATVWVLFGASGGYSLDGMVLQTSGVPYNNGALTLRYLSTGESITLVNDGVWGPSFSPDGRQIAYSYNSQQIRIMNLDGSGDHQVSYCDNKEVYVTWAGNGYLYWNQTDPNIYRCKTDGTGREVAYTASMNVHNLGVSQDGRWATWTRPPASNGDAWHCMVLDFSSRDERDFGEGCMNTPSPDGTLMTHNQNGHQWAVIEYISNGSTYKTLYPPESGPFSMHRWSHSERDWILFIMEGPNRGYLHNIETDVSTDVGDGIAWDYFAVEIHPGTEEASVVLSQIDIGFSAPPGGSATPAQAVVNVTNDVAGTTLGELELSYVPTWLTVVKGGSGNARTLTHTVNTSQMPAEGHYEIEITVSADNTSSSAAYRVSLDVFSMRTPDNPAGCTEQGVAYQYYEGAWQALPDFSGLAAAASGTAGGFDISVAQRSDNYALRFDGYLAVPQDGQYTFYTVSDDGSKLYIGNTEVVDNDGEHAAVEASGTISLAAGKHAIRVAYFQTGGGSELGVSYQGPGIAKAPIDGSALCRIPATRQPVIVSMPNGGEVYRVGSVMTVRWDADCQRVGGVKVELTANDGRSWSIIEVSGSLPCGNQSWQWTIPATVYDDGMQITKSPVSDSCRIKVAAYIGSDEDVSDGLFRIVPEGASVLPTAGPVLDRGPAVVREIHGRLAVVLTEGGEHRVELVTPQGRAVCDFRLLSPGIREVADTDLAPGAYLLRIESPRGVQWVRCAVGRW